MNAAPRTATHTASLGSEPRTAWGRFIRHKSQKLRCGSRAKWRARYRNLYGRAKDVAQDATDAAAGYANDVYHNSGDTLRDGTQVLAQKVQENPLGSVPFAMSIRENTQRLYVNSSPLFVNYRTELAALAARYGFLSIASASSQPPVG